MRGCKVLTRSKKERQGGNISKTEKTNTSIMSQFNSLVIAYSLVFSVVYVFVYIFFILSVLVFHTIKTTERQFFE